MDLLPAYISNDEQFIGKNVFGCSEFKGENLSEELEGKTPIYMYIYICDKISS